MLQLIVATSEDEVSRLNVLHERGIKNEVPDLKVVGPDEIREIEPNCVVGVTSLAFLPVNTSSCTGMQ